MHLLYSWSTQGRVTGNLALSPYNQKMAFIHNTDLTKELKEGAKLQQLRDIVPNQLADKVVPTMETNPKFFRRINIVKKNTVTNSTAGTIYTTPSDKDFYLCAINLTVSKDATATSLLSEVRIVVDNLQVFPISIATTTTTTETKQASIVFNNPIKIDRGTNISGINSTANANISLTVNVLGYTVDNPYA